MTTGILLTARLGSSRLRKKHLLSVNGQPILSYLIRRIKTAFQQEIAKQRVSLVIATSDESENRQFELLCAQGISVFYGSVQNIPLRHLQVADKYNFDRIISVDGDDIFCSTEGMRQVYQMLANGKEYVKTNGLPFGMNVVGYTKDFLQASLHNSSDPILETGWGRIFDETRLTVINLKMFVNHEHMRFTLDYPEDFTFFEKLITQFPGNINCCSDQEIVEFVKKKQFYKITSPVLDTYWANFNHGVGIECNNKEKRDE